MSSLASGRIAELIAPFYPAPNDALVGRLGAYLALLLRWNARQNLTAIRDPETIVRRHFGESLFLAQHLPQRAKTLLDLGSGAGFPGIPVQLASPGLLVTLAESQGKKAAFLRETVRELGLPTEVWAKRAEELPSSRRFDIVALRAVDRPAAALKLAKSLCDPAGATAHLTICEGQSGLLLGRPESQEFFPFPG